MISSSSRWLVLRGWLAWEVGVEGGTFHLSEMLICLNTGWVVKCDLGTVAPPSTSPASHLGDEEIATYTDSNLLQPPIPSPAVSHLGGEEGEEIPTYTPIPSPASHLGGEEIVTYTDRL